MAVEQVAQRVVAALSLEVFKDRLDWTLSNLISDIPASARGVGAG